MIFAAFTRNSRRPLGLHNLHQSTQRELAAHLIAAAQRPAFRIAALPLLPRPQPSISRIALPSPLGHVYRRHRDGAGSQSPAVRIMISRNIRVALSCTAADARLERVNLTN